MSFVTRTILYIQYSSLMNNPSYNTKTTQVQKISLYMNQVSSIRKMILLYGGSNSFQPHHLFKAQNINVNICFIYLNELLGININVQLYGNAGARNSYLHIFLMNDIYFQDQLPFSRLYIDYELIQDVLIYKTIENC